MSNSDTPNQNGANANGPRDPELDVSKLHALPSEQQDLYIVTFVSELRNHVEQLSSDALPGHQLTIKKEIIKILGLASPVPSRIIRNILGKTLADSFHRGSLSLLYETINELVSMVNTGKSEKEWGNKHAAVVCLGELFRSVGDNAVSLAALVVQSLLKLIKVQHVGIRGSVFQSLGLLVQGLRSSLDEQVARDLWKQARSAATNDKSAYVQKTACICLRSLASETPYFNNSNDFENLKSSAFKVIDSTVPAVRHAAAAAVAAALIQSFTETNARDVPILRKPKKSNKTKGTSLDDEPDVELSETSTQPQPKSSVRLNLSLVDVFKVLSVQYCKPSTTNRGRSALALCYRMLLRQLPTKVVEENYGTIANHFFSDLLNHPSLYHNRYRLLITRNFTKLLLSDVIASEMLTENAQINAARFLINDVLKNYPQVIAERREPPKRVLTGALEALCDLLCRLGSAASSFQDSCREALFQVMQHPSYTVQSHVARCFKAFVLACPSQLSRSISQGLTQIQKELDPNAESRHGLRRSIGYAISLAAILSCAHAKPLYGSIELYSQTFGFATDLLKSSAASELRLSAAQIQVAWTLIGGLMNLGPSFVKIHLNQLLLLWRNALPPPLTQENAAKRGHLELSFLAHVRECALTALFMFLDSCSSLVTTDGSRRIATMLQNTVLFLESLPSTRHTEDISHRLVPSLQLQDIGILLRRRLFQCYCTLLSYKHLSPTELLSQSDLVGLTMRAFTNPERPFQKNLEASLASSASNFEGLWDVGDNWGFGVTSLVQGNHVYFPSGSRYEKTGTAVTSDLAEDEVFDDLIRSPVVSALEHDPALLYRQGKISDFVELSPPSTSCTNSAIKLFAITLPLLSGRIQESTMEQLTTILSMPLQRDPGRKASMQTNSLLALLFALAVANRETTFLQGKMNVQMIGKATAEILRRSILDSDPIMRSIGAAGLGRLCNLSGTQFTNSEVKILIDMIVSNRDPNVRAGCALTLGFIHSEVGAMAASLHIKNIVGVLLSLCNDTHPIVHFWALKGLVQVAESAGLAFSTYSSSTLGMVAQLYSNDTHNETSASLASSNIELEYSTPLVLAQCIDCIINVLGPDLQEMSKPRHLILTLIGYLKEESAVSLRYQCFVCLGHLSMYVPAHVQFSKYVQDLQKNLASIDTALCRISASGLGDLVKRGASEVARVASSKLSDELWSILDQRPDDIIIQTMLRNWMQQSALTEIGEWIERCQTILSKTRAKNKVQPQTAKGTAKSAMPDLADEEVAGFAVSDEAAQGEVQESAAEGQEFLRWQTRDFAMRLLSELLSLVQDSMLPDQTIPAEEILQTKVAEIVRIAFSASTANVVELRIWGLRILDQILNIFGKTPDPDFLEASLLEQYQAQISSALTPAFSADSSPELAAEAISVCATFVATGIVTNADRMGRIFKVLAIGVDNLVQPEPEPAIGDLKNLSSNAQVMLKMALLSGWAQLQLASAEQTYLEDILKPYIPKLAPLWLNSLQEFAALRFEPEISDTLGGDSFATNLDDRYAAFNRVVRLRFYQMSWLNLVNAIAALVEKDSDAVFDALDNKKISLEESSGNGTHPPGKDMSFREEPVAFFFILFGLAFEALVTQARENSSQALAILQALKKILTPAVSGNAIYEAAVFNETTDTLDRLAMTSMSNTQAVLVEIARNLSLDHLSAKDTQDRDDKLSDDIEQLFELTRIVILVLTGLVPTLEDPPGQAIRKISEDSIALVQLAFQALVDVSDVFPSIIRADLHACIFHCYCTMLATGICQTEVIPRIMPVFRAFLQSVVQSGVEETSSRLARGCLHRMLTTLSFAQRRENEFSIICAKNTLLSITVLFTTAGPLIPASDPLISRAMSEILDCLQDVGLEKIAANCVRSLLLTNPKSSCDEVISRIVWPRAVAFVGDPSAPDPELVKTILAQSLVSSVVTLSAAGRVAAMSILVPLLVKRATEPLPNGSKEDLKKEGAARLLELAASSQQAFRTSIGLLDQSQRRDLENLLRAAGADKKRESHVEDSSDSKPAIELRMDF